MRRIKLALMTIWIPILEGAEIKFVNVTVDDWTDFDGNTTVDGNQPIDVTMP